MVSAKKKRGKKVVTKKRRLLQKKRGKKVVTKKKREEGCYKKRGLLQKKGRIKRKP